MSETVKKRALGSVCVQASKILPPITQVLALICRMESLTGVASDGILSCRVLLLVPACG